MVDTHDLKSCAFKRTGSSPVGGIKHIRQFRYLRTTTFSVGNM